MKNLLIVFLLLLPLSILFAQNNVAVTGGTVTLTTSYGYGTSVQSSASWCSVRNVSKNSITISVDSNLPLQGNSSSRTASISGTQLDSQGKYVGFSTSIFQAGTSASTSHPNPCLGFKINGVGGLLPNQTTYSFTAQTGVSGYSYTWTVSESTHTASIVSGQGSTLINVHADPLKVSGMMQVSVSATHPEGVTCGANLSVSPL